MEVALELARSGLGLTAPNPSVGAVLVRAGQIVGEGVTAPGGRPHAERRAIDAAGAAAAGSTLYVTLEPCARRSQRADATACTDLVIAAGITRVVLGAEDPSPHAAQEGLRRIASAGIALTTGVLSVRARRLNLGHVLRITAGRPMVTLKLATTSDGFVATAQRKPLAITGEAAREVTHRLRASHDAILVGIGTVLADDPALTCRLPGLEDRSPVRVVLDSQLRLPETAQMVTSTGDVPTWVFAAVDAPIAAERRLRARGVEVMRVERATGRRGLDLEQVLQLLAARGVTRLMVEGGPSVAETLAALDLIDDLVLLEAPWHLGEPGLPAFGRALAGWRAVIPIMHETLLSGNDRVVVHERTR
jgi:diaminohydroxyphosphoribosylaminopyrimidine deaminase/5-amino-6-(5-phosphoribosylamino)uracil reductase